MTTIKSVLIDYPQIERAEDIEDVLCLSTLITSGELSPNATVEDSKRFYEKETREDCGNCPFRFVCLACIINE